MIWFDLIWFDLIIDDWLIDKLIYSGMMRTVYGDHERFEKTYFSKFPGYYMSGDGAKRDMVSSYISWILHVRGWS